ERILEGLGVAGERGRDGARDLELCLELLDRLNGAAERAACRKVEGYGDGGELSELIDGEGPGGALHSRAGADRDELALDVADAHVGQLGCGPVDLVGELHHHVEAVAGPVDRGDLPAAEA